MAEPRRPLVAEIKRNSLDDGPGIRSVVFFKGCPLSCVWCHNPECVSAGPELIHRPGQCIGCKSCVKVCPERAIPEDLGPPGLDRAKCSLCGDCADECPSGALAVIGKYYEPEALAQELVRDRRFYDNSGGGVTLSGGEPTLHLDYVAELARLLKSSGVRVLLETCGDFDWDRVEAKLLPLVDQVFIDLKLAGEEDHKKFTGRDNRRIKQNLERLLARGAPPTLVRVPLVPNVTATAANLAAIAAFLAEHGARRLALLPYNPLWIAKARGLGKDLKYDHAEWMTKVERAAVKEIFKDFELDREI